jgi:sulfite exporter TauE/SafE/plastocyanin domain-containing protein/copper chaperone CopZ
MAKHRKARKKKKWEHARQAGHGPDLMERVYYAGGMHCPACEILIEKKLIGLDNVHSVEASTSKERVVVEYEGQAPSIGELNKLFKPEGYSFTLSPPHDRNTSSGMSFAKVTIAVIVAVVLIVLLQKAGLARLVTVNSKSSLPVFLLLGLVAGFSSCAALVGGIVLSMSKQWGEIYSPDDPFKKRIEPHLLFNVGRLISFALLGAVLAMIGGSLRLTPSFSAILVLVISLIMIVLGLQMLGVRFLQRFQFTMPKSVTRYVADETHFKGRYMPFTMGALTFFVPCGFAITAQSFALLSGKPIQGALIMLFFALGTLPMLLVIGFTSVKFLEKPKLAANFLKVAGVLVLWFALFNINNQLAVLNAPNLADLFGPASAPTSATAAIQMPPIVGGKQILKMEATASGYSPNKLTVRVGVPVRWEVRDTGTSGCTNAIISQDLFSGQVALTPGKTSTKEFTPKKPGKYRFSCWMGMVTGTINVVDSGGKEQAASGTDEPSAGSNQTQPVPQTQPADPASSTAAAGLPPVVDGKQVLKMEASASGYSPDRLKVAVNTPVRWEIKDTGTSGCTNVVKTQSLFNGEVTLTHGQTSVKEFVPTKVGRFRYSCWMGMVKGVIDVVDPANPNQTKFDYDESTTPSPSACPCCG